MPDESESSSCWRCVWVPISRRTRRLPPIVPFPDAPPLAAGFSGFDDLRYFVFNDLEYKSYLFCHQLSFGLLFLRLFNSHFFFCFVTRINYKSDGRHCDTHQLKTPKSNVRYRSKLIVTYLKMSLKLFFIDEARSQIKNDRLF